MIKKRMVKSMKNKALFIINSISNGGAERVCTNMANELIKEQYDVDFILLKPIDKEKYNYLLVKLFIVL